MIETIGIENSNVPTGHFVISVGCPSTRQWTAAITRNPYRIVNSSQKLIHHKSILKLAYQAEQILSLSKGKTWHKGKENFGNHFDKIPNRVIWNI